MGKGKVWELATDDALTWDLQEFIDKAPEDDDVVTLVRELHGHVVQAMRSPQANHVLQKFIQRVPSDSLQFVIDELRVHGFLAAAKHEFGCRIMQRLIENLPSAQLEGPLNTLLTGALELSKHKSGHFVMVCALEQGQTDNCTYSIAVTKALTNFVSSLGEGDKVHSSYAHGECLAAVFKTALEDRADESCVMIDARKDFANALMRRIDVLVDLVSAEKSGKQLGFRHGPETVKLAFDLAGATQEQFTNLMGRMTKPTRYGRELIKKLRDLTQQAIFVQASHHVDISEDVTSSWVRAWAGCPL